MKRILLGVCLLGWNYGVFAASAVEYVAAVEQINADYKKESRQFLSSLNPQQQGFRPEQNAKFCGIVGRYVDRLYQAADQNRAYLDRQFQNMTKQDVIREVKLSKEMQLLKRYHVDCDLQ
ncbi:hypothetical protein VXQ92_11950 [Acinetobacter sp. 228]|uniref:hypothetical protein n=1 Tax=Acinetobacter sp. 228 TaxID=3114700 RepID=UPI003A85793C